MRLLPGALAEQLAAGVSTLAHVWLVTRRDGAAFAFTDHDRPLPFAGLTCEPAQGLRAGAIEKSTGLGVDSASIVGALSSNAISEADIAAGLWDGARVDLFLVDWTNTATRAPLFSGAIGEVKRGATAFEAELRGVQAPFNRPVGRVFSRFCDAELGDSRCGVDADAASFQAFGLGGFADAWFERGKITWADRGVGEVVSHRAGGAAALIELAEAPGAPLAVGASFVVRAGCDKRFETCRAKFANALNFRGFPHMPGNDAAQAGPPAGQALDGGSRFA